MTGSTVQGSHQKILLKKTILMKEKHRFRKSVKLFLLKKKIISSSSLRALPLLSLPAS